MAGGTERINKELISGKGTIFCFLWSYFSLFNLNVLRLYILEAKMDFSTNWPDQFERVDMLMRGTRTHAHCRASTTPVVRRTHAETEELSCLETSSITSFREKLCSSTSKFFAMTSGQRTFHIEKARLKNSRSTWLKHSTDTFLLT